MFIKKNAETNQWDVSFSDFELTIAMRLIKGLDLTPEMDDRAAVMERQIFGVRKAESNPAYDTRKPRETV